MKTLVKDVLADAATWSSLQDMQTKGAKTHVLSNFKSEILRYLMCPFLSPFLYGLRSTKQWFFMNIRSRNHPARMFMAHPILSSAYGWSPPSWCYDHPRESLHPTPLTMLRRGSDGSWGPLKLDSNGWHSKNDRCYHMIFRSVGAFWLPWHGLWWGRQDALQNLCAETRRIPSWLFSASKSFQKFHALNGMYGG